MKVQTKKVWRTPSFPSHFSVKDGPKMKNWLNQPINIQHHHPRKSSHALLQPIQVDFYSIAWKINQNIKWSLQLFQDTEPLVLHSFCRPPPSWKKRKSCRWLAEYYHQELALLKPIWFPIYRRMVSISKWFLHKKPTKKSVIRNRQQFHQIPWN